MTDNKTFQTVELATLESGVTPATKEVDFSGDTTDVQLVELVAVDGAEGARTLHEISGSEGILTRDFLIEVAKGNVPGHSLVHKFGRNPSISSGTPEDIWNVGGDYVFPSAAGVVSVVSDSALDAAVAGTGGRQVTIEGLDANYDPISETVDLNGVTSVDTVGEFLRVNRAYISASGSLKENQGSVSGTLGGTDVFEIPPSEGATQLGLYTTPAGKTGYILSAHFFASKGSNSSVTGSMRLFTFGGAFRIIANLACHTAGYGDPVPFLAALPIPEKSDIKVRCDDVTSNNTAVFASFEILLVDD